MTKNIDEILRKENEKVKGSFPQGKLNGEDEGAISISVGTEKGKVIIKFATHVAWIGLDANQARILASHIMRHADAIDNTVIS